MSIYTKNLWVENPTTGEELELNVSWEYSYDPGRNYMPNGDPGYPAETTFNIDYVATVNGEEVPAWVTDEMLKGIIVDLSDWC